MLKRFLPNEYVNNVFEINPEHLKEIGIKGIVTDLDNTLVPWDVPHATERVMAWFEEMLASDLKVMVISNNNDRRVSVFSEPLDVPYIANARKPLTRSFIKAAAQFSLKPEEVAVIGDQLLTDVFGGNRGGFYTILVVPIVETDAWITKFNRMIERRILNHFEKNGKLKRRNDNG